MTTPDPCATPVTGTGTLVALVGKVTVAGTEATAGFDELRLIVRPAGAGVERFNVRLTVPPVAMVRLPCWKLSVALTCTCPLDPTKPPAEALMFAVPKLTAVTVGWVAGVVL